MMDRPSSQSRRKRRWAILSLGATIACATLAIPSSAQTVRGTVTSDGQPIPGVLLTLLDSATHIGARALTNADGHYTLTAPFAGRYRIYSLRIGYRPTTSDWLNLDTTSPLTRAIALTGIPVALDAVRVIGQGECRLAGVNSAATFALWEQARGAMIAARVTSPQDSLVATKVLYDKTLDPSSQLRDARYAAATSVVTDPWRAPSAEVLERSGFVTTDDKGYTTYNAPDLDVLLSDVFTINHCFRIAESPDMKRIGLRFEPTEARSRSRKVTDIQGTMWLDRASSELREMEFGYTNLPRSQTQNSGGDLRFTRFRDGTWAISEWFLRMPVLAWGTRMLGSFSTISSGADVKLQSIQIVGGELAVATRGNDTLFARPGYGAHGVVRDSVTHSPVKGARVHIGGTAIDAVTDESGRFAIDRLLPGDYELDIHTTSLDSLGAMNRIGFEFADTAKAIDVRVPNAAQVTAKLCALTQARPARGLLIGTVTVPPNTTWALADKTVAVYARWSEPSSKERVHELTAKPDANGNFRICGVPLDALVTVATSVDQRRGSPTEIRVSSSSRFARANLIATDHPLTHIAGVVRADSTATPLAAADISLSDVGRAARSDEQGRFRIDSVEIGTHHITLRRIGYEMIDTSIVLDGKSIIEPEFHLRRSVVLDSVRVMATSRDLRLRDFEDNRRLGLGQFMTRADIEQKEGLTMVSLLGGMTGARIVTGTHGAAMASTRGQTASLMNQPQDRGPDGKLHCLSTVYIDNVRIFQSAHDDHWFDLNTLHPEDIEAIEYYAGPSEMPARYNQLNSLCGVLVVHTRH
jgi:hypothetical protein